MTSSKTSHYRNISTINLKKATFLFFFLLLFTVFVSAQDTPLKFGWTASDTGHTVTYYDTAVLDSTTAVLVGDNGIIVRSTDSGSTWTTETVSSTDLFAVEYDFNITAAVGAQGEVIINTGNGWAIRSIPVQIQLNGLSIINESAICVVGDAGAIWITNDLGDNWIAQTSGTTTTLHDVSFFNKTLGLAVGDNGIVLGTLDGGSIWGARVLPTEVQTRNLYAVDFYSATRAYIVGENGTFLRSTSQENTIGFSWTNWDTPTTADFYDLYVASTYKVFMVGTDGTIYVTKDGGNLFKPQDIDPQFSTAVLYGISMIDDVGFIAGDNGIVLYTNTQGYTNTSGPTFRNFNDWDVYFNFIKPILIEGFYGTLSIVYFSMILGFSIGIVLAILKTTRIGVPVFVKRKTINISSEDPETREIVESTKTVWAIKEINLLGILATLYTDFFRNTPLLVQFFIIHFGLVEVGVDLTLGGLFERAYLSSILALGLNSGAYQAEIIRSGILAIPTGQMEAGRSLGLTYVQTMRYIILPQAVRIVIPPLGNEMINLILNSSLAYTIGYFEITRGGRLIISTSFKTFETWAIVLLMYFVITYSMANLLKWYERKSKIPGLGLGEI